MVVFRARHACLCYVAPALQAVQPLDHFQKGAASSKQVGLHQLSTTRRARQLWLMEPAIPLEVQVLLSTEQKVHKPGT